MDGPRRVDVTVLSCAERVRQMAAQLPLGRQGDDRVVAGARVADPCLQGGIPAQIAAEDDADVVELEPWAVYPQPAWLMPLGSDAQKFEGGVPWARRPAIGGVGVRAQFVSRRRVLMSRERMLRGHR